MLYSPTSSVDKTLDSTQQSVRRRACNLKTCKHQQAFVRVHISANEFLFAK